jgi:hypothetical protein
MAVRVVETKDVAQKTFRTFYDRPSERELPLEFGWPGSLQEVGIGQAEMYSSNKWMKNRAAFDDYKHVAEGMRTVYVEPGFLRVDRQPGKPIPVVGPMVSFEEPMPQHFARLGPLLGVQLRLYERDERGELQIPKGDSRLYEVHISRAMLGAADHPKTKETFLFVYTSDGVHMILTGDRLSIEKDGIAG